MGGINQVNLLQNLTNTTTNQNYKPKCGHTKEKEFMKSCILNKEISSWGLSPLRTRETPRKENGGFVSDK